MSPQGTRGRSGAGARHALVTGGAGFIGSHVVDRLIAEGFAVGVLDDFSSGHERNLTASLEHVELHRGDIGDEALLARALEGVDVVIHLAAIASVVRSIDAPERTNAVNLDGTLRLLEGGRHAGVSRVVLASSAAIYGNSETLPCAETLPASCLSPYALQKHASEGYLSLYSRIHGLQTASLRFFNVYGPRQDPAGDYAAVIPLFVEAALRGDPVELYGDGDQTRDFVFVDDVVEAVFLAATAPGVRDSVLNVASGQATSVNQLVDCIGQCVGGELAVSPKPPRSGEVRYSWADIGQARQQLGWAPRIGLQQGLSRTVEAFGKNAA